MNFSHRPKVISCVISCIKLTINCILLVKKPNRLQQKYNNVYTYI